MLKFKIRLATVVLLTVFSTAAIVSCSKQGNKEEHPAGEHPKDSTEHPADSTEHPSDSTEHPTEHPADSTKN